MTTQITKNNQVTMAFFLSEILGSTVYCGHKKVGHLSDVLIEEKAGSLPEVTHLCISRPFGDPRLYMPFDYVKVFDLHQVILDNVRLNEYERQPSDESIFLRDYVMDKKVIDISENEVEVVYDVKLALVNGRLLVTDADLSRYGLLRRMHLKWLANLLGRRIGSETLSWKYIQPLPTDLGTFKGRVKLNILRETLSEIPPVDLADILEELDPAQRVMIFEDLETEHASETLEEIDPSVQRSLVSSLRKEKVVALLNEMTPAQAADVLSILPHGETLDILALLDKEMVDKIRPTLNRQEETIQSLATGRFVRFSPHVKVGDAEDEYRFSARNKDVIMYIYVVDEADKLLGVVDLKELLQADNEVKLEDIMSTNIISLNLESTLREASDLFKRYGFRAIPLIDEASGKILGVVTYRDVPYRQEFMDSLVFWPTPPTLFSSDINFIINVGNYS